MIIAVVAMLVVQMPIHEVIDVIAVWNRFVTTIGAVLVPLLVTGAMVIRSACAGIRGTHWQGVFFDLPAALMMQVAVVEVIDVAIVENARVAAVRTMLVRVVAVFGRHLNHLLLDRALVPWHGPAR